MRKNKNFKTENLNFSFQNSSLLLKITYERIPNLTNGEIQEYSVNRIQVNNKKIEEINTQIFNLKIVLRQIQQFSRFARNNNLAENQFQFYLNGCEKYINKQNEIIVELFAIKDILNDLLREWKTAQKFSVIDGFYGNNICQIQEWISSLVGSINRIKELLMQFRDNIPLHNNNLLASIDETKVKIDNMITDLIKDSFVIEEQPNISSQPSQPLIIITKTKFEAKVRLLIVNSSITNPFLHQARVHVRLLNAKEVNCLNDEGIDPLMSSPPISEIKNSSQHIKYDAIKKELSATFTDMELHFKRNRRGTNIYPVAEEKFTLLFVTKVKILNRDFTLCVSQQMLTYH